MLARASRVAGALHADCDVLDELRQRGALAGLRDDAGLNVGCESGLAGGDDACDEPRLRLAARGAGHLGERFAGAQVAAQLDGGEAQVAGGGAHGRAGAAWTIDLGGDARGQLGGERRLRVVLVGCLQRLDQALGGLAAGGVGDVGERLAGLQLAAQLRGRGAQVAGGCSEHACLAMLSRGAMVGVCLAAGCAAMTAAAVTPARTAIAATPIQSFLLSLRFIVSSLACPQRRLPAVRWTYCACRS